MKILDKYIIKELLFPFISGILAFSFILAGSTVLPNLVSDAVKFHIQASDFMLLILLQIPSIFALAIPMAILFGTITVFGRLGNDLEIIALRANGVSVIRLLYPIIISGLVVSLMAFYFNETIVPKAQTTATNLFLTYRHQDKPFIQKNVNITEYKNNLPFRIINIAEMDSMLLKNVTIAEYEEGALVRLIRAKHGRWLSGGAWQFSDGIMHSFLPDDPRKITVLEYKNELINIDITPIDLQNRNKSIEEMSRKELMEKIKFEQKTGQDPIKYIMNYHLKLSVAFSCLIYSILGSAMGLRPHRSSSALGLGISLVVILVYVVLVSVGMGLGLAKLLDPLVAAWFPNIIVGTFSLFLVRKLAMQ